ncbi:helix-turn-helix transcriptional regulator [Streptomyces sp. NPDC046859]|uniref:helix-turn-helix domain-containing protein n=1 Tax=Streptomyces sp. NPDC046859 TaxID=3155734 RepID=UPI0034086E8E
MSEARDDVQEFAVLLRRLKERTDRSYGQLARRLAMNTSTLHRYCAGEAVPLDFAPVERFAALCAATPEERLELHRLWILAVAARQRARTQGAKPAAPAPAPAPEPKPEPEETTEAPAKTAEAPAEPAPDVTPPPAPASTRPRSRRRRLLVLTAAATALLAGLGTLAALPDDRPRGSDRVQAADPTRTTPAPTSRPSPPRSPAPTATTASPSPRGSKKSASREEGGSGPSKGAGRPKPAGTPLTWSVDSHVWQAGCGHDYVLTRPPQQVPPPPPPQDARTWATSLGAVHGGQTMVRVSVQGRSSTAVVLEALRVRVVSRAAPLKGTVYAMDRGCGGALTPRFFDVDLDRDRPVARPQDGNDTGTPIPAMRLPYQVSATDPEVLLVTAETETCDCSWYLELDWSSQGRTGTVRIDDAGRPFRTTGVGSLPRYMYETSDRAWVPYS